MTFEIFGLTLSLGWYIIVFFICSLINVILNTLKTIIMHKEQKISSTIINAITYGFYAIIVVMTASALDLWITILITILANAIGVYGSMWLLEKFKKDSVWEIVANIKVNKTELSNFEDYLGTHDISYNLVKLYGCDISDGKTPFTAHIYSENQYQSEKIKYVLDKLNAKYIVHEERVKL
jgi:hypothetical protein